MIESGDLSGCCGGLSVALRGARIPTDGTDANTPFELLGCPVLQAVNKVARSGGSCPLIGSLSGVEQNGGDTLFERERAWILRVLAEEGGNRTHTARRLGVSVRTIRNKLARYGRSGPA